MWKKFNNNPAGRNVGDCAVRAISVALSVDWETAFAELVASAFFMCDMPSSDAVWCAVLRMLLQPCVEKRFGIRGSDRDSGSADQPLPITMRTRARRLWAAP